MILKYESLAGALDDRITMGMLHPDKLTTPAR
jgi:hypothetical protein